MSVRNILLNPYKYPLPSFPSFIKVLFGTNSLIVQDEIQRVYINNLPTLDELAILGITEPVVIPSLTTNSAFTGLCLGMNYVDFDIGEGYINVAYANLTDCNFTIWICQVQ